jgi:outer membrane protein TolC
MIVLEGSFAVGASAGMERYDLKACVDLALQANPKIEEANREVDVAQWQLKSAELARTPKVELFDVMGVVKDATEGPSGEPALTGDTEDSYGYFNKLDVKFSLPLYTFGRLTRSIEAAQENVGLQDSARVKTKSDLVLRVHELYYGLVLSRQLLDSMREVEKNFSEARNLAEERLERNEASVTEADVLKLRVGLAGVTKAVHRLEREAQVTKEALRQAMGLESRTDFDVSDTLLKPVSYELKPLETYLRETEEHNPDVKRLKAAVAAEESRYLAEKSKFYPTVLAVGGVNYAVAPGRPDIDNPFLNDDFNYTRGGGALALQWDLNFWQVNAEVQQKRARLQKTRASYQTGVTSIQLSVKDKYHRAREKQDNLEASQEARKAGRGLLVLNVTNFKFGIGTGKDVFEALSLYTRTASDYFESIFDYNMAVAELQAVAGSLIPAEREPSGG